MDLEEIKQTDIWTMYEKHRNFLRMKNMYSETDLNYQMAFGNQWQGLKSGGIEPVQYNIIETIIGHKVSAINQNLWQIHFGSENFDSKEFRKTAEKTCDMLNKKASQVWESDKMDYKVWGMSEDSAVNSEGIVYVDYDEENQKPKNEILNKTDIMYGNENNSDIQMQPYILIRQRMPLMEVIEMARAENISEEKIKQIKPDKDTFELTGVDSKYEVDDMCTVITKMWKEKGTVHFSKSAQYVIVKENKDTGLSLYPLTHMLWRELKGSARGEGEVKYLIPNQLEINKTLMRYLLTIKETAYPKLVANIDCIVNPDSLNKIGATIKVDGMGANDVSKIVSTTSPAQMSYDVSKSIQDLISITRELHNASEITTGGVNPEDASGRAILAVQQASKQPLSKQANALKTAIEDLGRIWLDMWTTYSDSGLTLEEESKDEQTGEKTINLVKVPKSVLDKLKATVKVDITPVSTYDKYAQELTLENLLKAGFFNVQNLGAFKRYVNALPDDSTAPKQTLLGIIDDMEEEQMKIAQVQAQAQLIQQRAKQFINNDVETQGQQMADAQQQINSQGEDTAQ